MDVPVCHGVGGSFDVLAGKVKRAPEAWQKLGMDASSILADPLFVDAATDDYRLRPESPALELGFEQTDTDRIGLKGAGSQIQGRAAGPPAKSELPLR